MKKKKREHRFLVLSRQNLFRTILYGLLLIVSIVLRLSWVITTIFAIVTICNIFLTKKSFSQEAKYAEKISKIEKAFGDDLSDKDRKKLERLVPKVKFESDINKEYLQNLIKKMDEEDAEFEELYEENEDDSYYDYEEPD